MRLVRRHLADSQRTEGLTSPFKMGIRRPARHLVGDVNVHAIQLFRPPHEIIDVKKMAIAGDAPKCFVSRPNGAGYIAKAPRKEGPRECVTEYLISCIGAPLPVILAKPGLFRLRVEHGEEPEVRFFSRSFRQPDEQLVHGIEIVARCFEMDREQVGKEVTRHREHGFYTIDTIAGVIESVFPNDFPQLADALGRMMGFDALVGANDRHPMNWGVLENVAHRQPVRFAPLFDTARGLFWNFSDAHLAAETRLPGARRAFIEKYARNSKPLIGVSSTKVRSKASHFDVVEYIVTTTALAPLAKGLFDVLRGFQPDRNSELLHRKFGRLFSRLRLELIDELLRHRHQRLKKLVGLP